MWLAPGCTRPRGNEERSSWMQSNGDGDKPKPQFRRHRHSLVRCLEMRSMACWMLDVGTCGNQPMLCYIKLFFCLLASYVSWVLWALQIAGAPRNTTGHRRRAMDPNAQSFASVLQRCSNDSPKSAKCHASVHFIAVLSSIY